MKTVIGFLASMSGRIIRSIVGIALIALGLGLSGTTGAIVVLIGIIPFAAGVFDFCLLARFLGYPFWGKELRERVASGLHAG